MLIQQFRKLIINFAGSCFEKIRHKIPFPPKIADYDIYISGLHFTSFGFYSLFFPEFTSRTSQNYDTQYRPCTFFVKISSISILSEKITDFR